MSGPEAYYHVAEWLNWAAQNPIGRQLKFGELVRRGCKRMQVPEPPRDSQAYRSLLLFVTRAVMNGPHAVDRGPEPGPPVPPAAKLEPERVEVKVKQRPVLVTPYRVTWGEL